MSTTTVSRDSLGRELAENAAALSAGPGSKHVLQLDGLRAIAIVGVLADHFLPHNQLTGALGYYGVRLFFVLSGFLITGILLDCRAYVDAGQSVPRTIRQFYARRFLRIFPIYYATLIVAWLAGIHEVRRAMGWALAYLTNLYFTLTSDWHYPLSHLWSLAVEEQFYLVWPVLVLLLPRRVLTRVTVVAIVTAPVLRAVWVAAQLRDMAIWTLPFFVLDTLGLGALVALSGVRPGSPAGDARWLRVLLWLAAPLAAWEALARIPWVWHATAPYSDLVLRYLVGNTAFALVFAWAVMRAAQGWRGAIGRLLELRPVVYLGQISYGVYVLHLFVSYAFDSAFGRWEYGPAMPAIRFVALTALTIALASLSWYGFERPINRLKRYFPYRLTPRASDPA